MSRSFDNKGDVPFNNYRNFGSVTSRCACLSIGWSVCHNFLNEPIGALIEGQVVMLEKTRKVGRYRMYLTLELEVVTELFGYKKCMVYN